jgi:hypothetical protein
MKQARRRRVYQQTQKLPHIIFTLNELSLLKLALVPFKRKLSLTDKPYPNISIALETATQIQAKISRLIQQGTGELVGFDKNEILIMEAALWMYIAALQQLEPGKERNMMLFRCQQLSRKIFENKAKSSR